MVQLESMRSDYTHLIEVITWFFLIVTILGVGARGITKAVTVRALSLDDYLISVALVFAVGQTVAVSVQTSHGYGDLAVTLREADISVILKAQYTAGLLYIASLTFAKTSVLALIRIITPIHRDRRRVYSLVALVVLWGSSAELGAATICHVPSPWDYIKDDGTTNGARRHFWNYIEVMNILTDVALIILPGVVIWPLQVSSTKKASVFSFFLLRSVVIAATICKLVFENRSWPLQPPGLDPWTMTICAQIVQGLSTTAACFLYLKPFLESVHSGFTIHDDRRRRGTEDYYGRSTVGSSAQKSNTSKRHGRQGSDTIGLNQIARGHNATTVTGGDSADIEDAVSQNSQSHIIKQTKTFAVEGISFHEADEHV